MLISGLCSLFSQEEETSLFGSIRLDVFISLENDPIMFPCGDLICSEHLNERDVKENEQKCNECQHEFKFKRHTVYYRLQMN